MSYKYVIGQSGDWDTPSEIPDSSAGPFYPLASEFHDWTTMANRRTFRVNEDSFESTLPKIGSKDPDYPKLYYVGFENKRRERDTVVYTARYYSIPTEKTKEIDTVWTAPGISTSAGLPSIVVSYSYSGNFVSLTLNTAAHDLEAGDYVSVNYFALTNNGGRFETYYPKIESVGGATIVVKRPNETNRIVFTWTFISLYWQAQVQKAATQRGEQTEVVISQIVSRWFWVGKNIKSYNEIPRKLPFRILSNDNQLTNTLTDNSTPNIDQYYDLVANNIPVVIEPSSITLWDDTPIYRVDTKYTIPF